MILARYEADIARHGFVRDAAQLEAVEQLRKLTQALAARPHRYTRWQQVKRRLLPYTAGVPPVPGLYLWGGVGRGKTYLMDLFFECAPFEDKKRSHFHRFMRWVHDELKSLENTQDPLRVVAERLALENRVICFDEFFVSDIADAMILGTLFSELFRRGVSLVATSNVAPADLYQDGLQRQRFLPAIHLLEQHTQVLHVGGDTDYRLRQLESAGTYHSPLNEKAQASLRRYFNECAPAVTRRSQPLVIEGRPLATVQRADGIVWFTFEELAVGTRSVADYIEIARGFHTVIVSGVMQMGADNDDAARRFVNLVDEFYDRRVKLILSAEVAVDALYAGQRLAFEFERTSSRLIEMQSRDYLAQPHLP